MWYCKNRILRSKMQSTPHRNVGYLTFRCTQRRFCHIDIGKTTIGHIQASKRLLQCPMHPCFTLLQGTKKAVALIRCFFVTIWFLNQYSSSLKKRSSRNTAPCRAIFSRMCLFMCTLMMRFNAIEFDKMRLLWRIFTTKTYPSQTDIKELDTYG